VLDCQVAQAEAALTVPADGADLPTSADTDMPSPDEPMIIVQTYLELERAGGGTRSQRRTLERQVRQHALAVADRLASLGLGLEEIAKRLRLKPRTLRHWEQMLRPANAPLALLGRPRVDSGPEQQQEVRDHLRDVGAGVSVPALRAEFPDMARAELDRLAKDYRTQWCAEHRRTLRVLHWLRPGAVWAMDFAAAPSLINGIYPHLLAVRDLASGKHLLWRPVRSESAATVSAELLPLFLAYGTPWVLKSDNGPAFRAVETKEHLAQWGVFALFSPPHTPSYNGGIEAAIGSLKARTQRLADQAGHPHLWTSELVERARHQANLDRPRRLKGTTPDAVWDARAPLTGERRALFRNTVERYQAEGWDKRSGEPADRSHWDEAAVDRVALRRALVAHDLLLFTRRSIPARIERPKVAMKG
jgi:transposase InsO family protein